MNLPKTLDVFSAILDTLEGSSFIRFKELPTTLQDLIKPLEGSVSIRNASEKKVPIVGTTDLAVKIGPSQAKVTFLVVKQLATEAILGFAFCSYYVEAIRPRRRHVKVANGSIVHIVHQPRCRNSELSLLDD